MTLHRRWADVVLTSCARWEVWQDVLFEKHIVVKRFVSSLWNNLSQNVRIHTFGYVRHRRFRSACAFAQSDQNLPQAHFRQSRMQSFFMLTTKDLIRLRVCTGWFVSSLCACQRVRLFSLRFICDWNHHPTPLFWELNKSPKDRPAPVSSD